MDNNMKIKLLPLLLLITTLSACGSFDLAYVKEQSEPSNLEPFRVRAGYELTDLRVDIFRKQYVSGKTVQNHDYSSIGIYLGNGMFLDSVGNLSVDLLDYFNIEGDYNIEQIGYNLLGKEAASGNTFKKADNLLEMKGIFFLDRQAQFDGNTITETGISIRPVGVITENEDSLTYNFTKNFLPNTHQVAVLGDYQIIMESDWHGNYGVAQVSATELIFNNKQKLVHHGDKITFEDIDDGFFGLGSSEVTRFTFVATKKGFAYYKKSSVGFLVEKIDDSIFVEQNGIKLFRLDIKPIE